MLYLHDFHIIIIQNIFTTYIIIFLLLHEINESPNCQIVETSGIFLFLNSSLLPIVVKEHALNDFNLFKFEISFVSWIWLILKYSLCTWKNWHSSAIGCLTYKTKLLILLSKSFIFWIDFCLPIQKVKTLMMIFFIYF